MAGTLSMAICVTSEGKQLINFMAENIGLKTGHQQQIIMKSGSLCKVSFFTTLCHHIMVIPMRISFQLRQ